MNDVLLDVRKLSVVTGEGKEIAPELSFTLKRGASIALEGPSGAGKSTLLFAIAQLSSLRTSGEVLFHGENLLAMRGKPLKEARKRIKFVFQNPDMALSPYYKVKKAFREAGMDDEKARNALRMVGLSESVLDSYPLTLSGGMRARVNIALSLSDEAEIVILDEATSQLDGKGKDEIISLLLKRQKEYGTSYIVVTHEDVVRERFNAPYLEIGRKEEGRKLYSFPDVVDEEVVLGIKGLGKSYGRKKVLDGIDLKVRKGERIGIIGENGSGKSTLLRIIAGIEKEDRGSVMKSGNGVMMLFQDAFSALDPEMKVKTILQEPLEVYEKRGWLGEKLGKERIREIARNSLSLFSIPEELWDRKARMLSGGEREKVYIASSLLVRPALLLMDESLSSLDGKSADEVLTLLAEKSGEYKFALLFVSHDINMVKSVATKIYKLSNGRLSPFFH